MTTAVRRNRFLLLAPFLGVAVLALVTPSDDGPTVCPFALFTGTACPGCGMTRAASYLVKGDLGAAFAYHPLVVLLAAQALGAWVWMILRRRGLLRPMSSRVLNLTLFGTAAALILVWAIRLIAGELPPV